MVLNMPGVLTSRKSAGYTKPRRLIPLHEEWEQEWNLLEMIENKVPLPACSSGAGQGFKRLSKAQSNMEETKRRT